MGIYVSEEVKSRRSKGKEEGGKRKERSRSRRERSSSRSRREESTPEPDSSSEKPKRKSVKGKKSRKETAIEHKEEELLQPKIIEAEEDLMRSSETIVAPTTPVEEVPKPKSPVPSDKVVIEELKSNESSISQIPSFPVSKDPSLVLPKTPTQTVLAEPVTVERVDDNINDEGKPAKPVERRKSKIFETAEKFNKITTDVQVKPQPKKVVLPGVKVSDAKKAYERRSSLASSANFIRGSSSRKSLSGESSMSSPPIDDSKSLLASSVALNKLVESVERMSKFDDENEMQNILEQSDDIKCTNKSVEQSLGPVLDDSRGEQMYKPVQTEDENTQQMKTAVQVRCFTMA